MIRATGISLPGSAIKMWGCNSVKQVRSGTRAHATGCLRGRNFTVGRPTARSCGLAAVLVVESLSCDHMTQYCDTNPGNLLLYFYFSFREKSKQVQHRCQSALLKQICREPKALREVKRLYDQAHKDSVPVSAQFGDVKACLDTTIKDLKGLKQVFIVLDALDELDNDLDDLQRTQMLQWIISVTTHESHVHVLFTSRSRSGRGDIEHAMDLHPDVLKIHIDAKANQDDMCLYLTDQFQASTALSSLPRASKKDLCDRLIGMADGMFLWTHCQLADLVKLPFLRPKDIRVILESMPKTLESTYSRILEDVSKFMLTEVVQALQWLSVALRPLTLQEINEACIIRLLELPIIDKDNQLPGDGVLSCLPGLVSRTIKDHDEYVLLAHFSVREFLMSRAAVKRGSSEAPFTFRDCTAHALIAESCIAYINYWCNRAPKNKMCAGAELKSFPLLQYACQHWAEHLNQTDENEQARLASAALQLLTRPEYITDVLSVYNPLEDWEKRPWRSWSRPSSSEHNLISHLGWAAVLGLPSVTTLVLRGTNPALNERGRIQDSTRCVSAHKI
ncbi:uncharacterized protein BO97DRAFT_203805 [Aspergillus homomorphus CBS 101889]|uniref:Nephrocystin 3-like N-terminal domain-containing protein n=1 Tax=Aspergillus homomorphus (strain CBS 101889) TaxID=1450537 RepID=A0A395HL65_ASPHC|nr:hypothetical protein BO97DRAFT_203805 [Aspergillus homomorphus CBS 101889]RAL08510.1 hypothetical protein BO97DRAFT_203805 [Aspergillus homomorphus CBS 101889]